MTVTTPTAPVRTGQLRGASPGQALRRVSLRNLAAHKIRLALTVLSVVLGTAFIAGSFVFTDTLKHTFNTIFSDVGKGIDVEVQPANTEGSGVPLSAVPTITAVDGVRAVRPVIEAQIVLLGSSGKAVQGGGAPSVGQAYRPASDQIGDPLQFVAGGAPAAPGQIALNSGAATLAKLAVGDRTRVLVPAKGMVPVTVSGIYKTKTETGGYVGALFVESQARTLFTDGSHVSAIDVAGNGVSSTVLRDRIAQALPGLTVKTGDQVRSDTKAQINKALSFINYFLLAFGAIALLVGTFIIYNTFSMLVAQRLRELALLRAIGASRRQVSRSVLLEAVLVGLVGSAIGIASGVGLAYGLRALLNSFNVGLPNGPLQLLPHTVVIALAVGIVVTVFSAYAPARRAAKTAPVAAMREEFSVIGTSLKRRTVIGAVFAVAGIAGLLAGAFGKPGGNAASLVGLGALGLILGVLLGAPALAQPIIGALGLPVARPFGAIGRLARTNATRNPRRTAATAFALTLGLMLVTAIAVFGASAKHSINGLVDNGVRADYILTGPDATGVPAGVQAAAATVPGVSATVALHPVRVKLAGKSIFGTGVDGPFDQVASTTMVAGSSAVSGHTLIAAQSVAASHHWTVGSRVDLQTVDQKAVSVTVGGIYKDNQLIGNWLVSGDFYREVTPTQAMVDEVVLVKSAPGTDQSSLKAGLIKATDNFVVVQVRTREEFKGSQAKQIDSLLAVLYGLLALAIVIAILGIINTLALSVVERRREIGMLRAVGMLRAQVRRTIYLESMLIAVFGAVIGVSMGAVFGSAFVHTLRDEGLGSIALPWGQIVLMLVLSAVVGVLAALWPAVRAARTRPLEAIAEL